MEYFRANVDGTANVLEAAKYAKVKRFIYAASSSCYGIPDAYPTLETAEIRPQYPYALTKRLGEELVMHWAQVYDLPAMALRLFNVYGPRSRTSGTYGAVFGVFLAQRLAGTEIGKDLIHAMNLIAEADAGVEAAEQAIIDRFRDTLGGQ